MVTSKGPQGGLKRKNCKPLVKLLTTKVLTKAITVDEESQEDIALVTVILRK